MSEYVESTWRVLYKLAKQLSDNPGAKRVAEIVRGKVEKFRQFLPVLTTVCNKGLQKRHWDMVCVIHIFSWKSDFFGCCWHGFSFFPFRYFRNFITSHPWDFRLNSKDSFGHYSIISQISEIVGVPLSITAESTLNEMIEAGLPKFSSKLEEISGSATKEYALEKNLKKMKEEWTDIRFDCVPYRWVYSVPTTLCCFGTRHYHSHELWDCSLHRFQHWNFFRVQTSKINKFLFDLKLTELGVSLF